MQRRLNRFFVFLTGILLWGGFSAAAVFASGQSEGAAASKQITITYWHHNFKPAVATDDQIIAAFEKQHPNVKVEYSHTFTTAQLDQKLLVAFAGGTGPDLFNQQNNYFPRYLSDGFIMPIDLKVFGVSSYQALKAKLSPTVAAGLSLWGHDGKYYGLTTQLSTYGVAVNTKQFSDAGLNAKTDYPKTWTQLEQIGQKLVKTKNGEIVRQAYGITSYPDTFIIVFEGMLRQLGGSIINAQGTKSTVNSPAGVKALDTLANMVYKYKISTIPKLNQQGPGFETGDTSIINDVGPWYKSYLQRNAPTIAPDLMFAPQMTFVGGKKIGYPDYGYALLVNKDTKHAAATWELAKDLAAAVKQHRAIGDFAPTSFPWPHLIATGGPTTGAKRVNDIIFAAATNVIFNHDDAQQQLNIAASKIDKWLQGLPYKVYGYTG